MKLLTFLCFFLVSSGLATAAPADPWPLIKTICFDQLHSTAKSVATLSAKGWKRHPAANYNELPQLRNVLTTGLQDEKSALFTSPGGDEVFLFGPADNELNPNNKCLYATSIRETDVPGLLARVSTEMSPLQPTTRTGKRFGNSNHEWSLGTFERNLSDTRAINHAVMNHFPNKMPTTNAVLNLSVVGMSRR